MPLPIPELLPGCECVRFGVCGQEEFVQVGESIYKGAAGFSLVVISPAAGYEFRYDVRTNAYRAAKIFDVKRTFTAVIACECDADLEYFEQISHMPVTVSITETTPKAAETPAAEAKP